MERKDHIYTVGGRGGGGNRYRMVMMNVPKQLVVSLHLLLYCFG